MRGGRPRRVLWCRGALIRFHDHLYFRAFLEFHLPAVLVFEDIFDANFTIQVVRALNGNLSLFRLLWMDRLDQFLDSPWFLNFGFSQHVPPGGGSKVG